MSCRSMRVQFRATSLISLAALVASGCVGEPVTGARSIDSAPPVFATSTTGVTITDLGTLGGANSSAYGINLSGEVTGRSDMPTGNGRAFTWMPPSGPMALLPIMAGYGYAETYQVNDNGVVVGMEMPGSGGTRATKWEPCTTGCTGGHTITELFAGTPYAGWNGYAIAINNRGQIAGYIYNPANSVDSAYVYDATTRQATFLQPLPYGPGAVPGATAWGINNNGHVVGYSRSQPSGAVPIDGTFWASASSPPQKLPGLASCTACTQSEPQAINDNDWIVGYVRNPTNTDRHAVVWKPSQTDSAGMPIAWTATDLGGFGGTQNVAYSINNAGQIVGFSKTAHDKASHAFLWQNGVMQDLGTATGSGGSSAASINNASPPRIAGSSSVSTQASHAVVWTVP